MNKRNWRVLKDEKTDIIGVFDSNNLFINDPAYSLRVKKDNSFIPFLPPIQRTFTIDLYHVLTYNWTRQHEAMYRLMHKEIPSLTLFRNHLDRFLLLSSETDIMYIKMKYGI